MIKSGAVPGMEVIPKMADREVTCKKCNVTNVGSTVYQALFDLKHDNSVGCNRLVAEYSFKDLQGEDLISGSLNSKGRII